MFKINEKQRGIKKYYKELSDLSRLNQTKEETVKIAFQHLLEAIAKQNQWVLTNETMLFKKNQKHIRLDGVLFDNANLPRGYWKALKDDLPKDVLKLYKKQSPQDNIIFQHPERAILIQKGKEVLDVNISEPANLVKVLDAFFNFKRPESWYSWILLGILGIVFFIPLMILFFIVKSDPNRLAFLQEYATFLEENDGKEFFCYKSSHRDQQKMEWVEQQVLPLIESDVEIVCLDGRTPKCNLPMRFVSQALYNIQNVGFPNVMKIVDGKMLDISLHDALYHLPLDCFMAEVRSAFEKLRKVEKRSQNT